MSAAPLAPPSGYFTKGLEAAVVLTEADAVSEADLAALGDLGGPGVVVHRGDPRGTVLDTVTS